MKYWGLFILWFVVLPLVLLIAAHYVNINLEAIGYIIGFNGLSALICGVIADKKRRNVMVWITAGLLLSFWAILILYFHPAKKEQLTEWAPSEQLRALRKK